MRKNKGFTLIELIVVIVIIAVLMTVAGLAISTANAASARKAADQLNAYLSTVRTDCMARAGDPYANIYLNSDGVLQGDYYENDSVVKSTVITDRRVSVSFSYGGVSGTFGEGVNNSVRISFARSTGKLAEPISSGELVFTVTGGGKTYAVTVLASTGNHESAQLSAPAESSASQA